MSERRVLFVALDGAEAAIASPLVDSGALPMLSRIIDTGAFGLLEAAPPLVRAMAWTTLATGIAAPDHGVCGDREPREDGAGVRPASHASWRVPAVWERIAASGRNVITIGWPSSAPATSWSCTCIDDAFAEPFGPAFDAWPLLPDCVSPVSLRDALRELRVHSADITTAQILALVPHATRVDQDRDRRLARLALLLARSSTVHAAATHLVESRDWQFMAVAYPLLADGMREFGRYRAPRLRDVEESDAEIYGEVVDRLYRVQDAMLGRLLELAGPDVTVIVASPFGMACGADRPDDIAAQRLPPSIAWHRPRGLLAAAGPGIASDVLVHDAHVEDMAPTLLALFGLHDVALDGRAIASMLATPPNSTFAKRAPRPRTHDAIEIDIADDIDDAERGVLQSVRVAAMSNAAEALLARGDVEGATAHYAAIVDAYPDSWLALARLARCHLQRRDFERARSLARRVTELAPDRPWGPLLSAAAHVLQDEPGKALPLLAQVRDAATGHPQFALRLATLYLGAGAPEPAEALYRETLAHLPDSAEAFDGLGCALLVRHRPADAEAAFRAALGCRFHFPAAHLHLAHALLALGRPAEAAECALRAREQDPQLPGVDSVLETAIARRDRLRA